MAMAISNAAMIRGGGAALMLCVGMSCASGQPHPAAAEPSTAMTEATVEPVGDAPSCVDDKDKPVNCLSDADCCQGFVCGRDPELNPRASYCIFGG
jgi:hypothetical protein